MRAFCVTWERRAVGNGCFLLFWWVLNAEHQTALNARFSLTTRGKTKLERRKMETLWIAVLRNHCGTLRTYGRSYGRYEPCRHCDGTGNGRSQQQEQRKGRRNASRRQHRMERTRQASLYRSSGGSREGRYGGRLGGDGVHRLRTEGTADAEKA